MSNSVEYIISLRDKFSSKLSGIQKQVNQLDKSTNVFKNTLGGLGGLLGGISFAALGVNIIKTASDAEEAASKFAVVFKSVQEASQNVSENLAKNYGLSSKASKELLANTGDLLTGFGFTGGMALDLSEQVNKLAVDLASFTNFEGGAKGASEALTKALLGERESVKALGIAILDSDVKARVKQLDSMGKLAGMTERQKKAYATLTIAQEQSKNSVGDFARTQDGFANKIRVLQARWEDLQVEVGQNFLPILVKLSEKFLVLIEWMRKNKELIVSTIQLVFKIAKYYLYYVAILKATSIVLGIVKASTIAYRIAMIALKGGIGKAIISLKGFKMALASTGIGLAVIVITELIQKFWELSEAQEEVERKQKEYNKTLKQYWEGQAGKENILNKLNLTIPTEYLLSTAKEYSDLMGDVWNEDGGLGFVKELSASLKNFNVGELEQTSLLMDDLIAKFQGSATQGGKDIFSNTISLLNQIKQKAESQLGKVQTKLGINTDASTKTKETKITSSAPKVFNINIDKLVENFTVSTNTLKESTGEIKEAVLNALLGSLNDTQIVLNQ